MNTRRWLTIIGIVLGSAFFDVSVVSHWPHLHTCIEPIVLAVIVITLVDGPVTGMIAGAVLGYSVSVTSVLPSFTHIVALVVTSLVCALVVRRVIAGRAQASFVASIMLGTLVYYLCIYGVTQLAHLVSRTSYILPVTDMVTALSAQLIVHPILLVIVWRVLQRDQFHQLRGQLHQSF